ncbi:MAG: hypothetical protein U1A05_00075, partial [Alphaproteobacteria bacterium]|nr:hypothetical protein [Alphaproteobacteria bacterium]
DVAVWKFLWMITGNGRASSCSIMQDTSLIPEIAEPWFLAFNAKVYFQPIMNLQDLASADPAITKASQEYGS